MPFPPPSLLRRRKRKRSSASTKKRDTVGYKQHKKNYNFTNQERGGVVPMFKNTNNNIVKPQKVTKKMNS